jgi:LEA14-like dessication related protein
MMIPRYGHRALAIAVALGLSACASLGPPQLSVQLSAVEVATAPPPDQRLKVSLRIVNRADNDVTVEAITYTLDIDGREFANGTVSQPIVVPRYGEATAIVTATSNAPPSTQAPAEAPGRTSVSGATSTLSTYRIRGMANTRFSRVPFDSQSELPAPTPAKPA